MMEYLRVDPINPVKNQYRGINAHLHSFWQSEGGWDSFHTNHIADLMREMNKHLFPLGYVADIERSLQIRRYSEPAGKPESDITIYDRNPAHREHQLPPRITTVEAVAIPEAISLNEEISPYRAVAIYEYVPGKLPYGKPVVWIELLSPSNKPGGQDAGNFRDKRIKLLESGIVFVEIDYLHESPLTLDYFPLYRKGRSGSHPYHHPYHIVVVDPRPKVEDGWLYPYHANVDYDLPTITIPLNGNDIFEVDMDAVYQITLSATPYHRLFVDYTQLPLNFDRYSPDDQARILNRMIAVIEAAQQGIDLEKSIPLPVGILPLNEALARVQRLGIVT
jgi:hypothetical protein